MKNFKYFFFILFICGCVKQGVERIRLVDANGNPVKINKIVPRFNEEQMQKQREALNRAQQDNNMVSVNRFNQNYNSQQNNNRFSQNSSLNDQNIIMPAGQYPNDIFDDRITNYNYIEEKKYQFNTENKTTSSNTNNTIITTRNNTTQTTHENEIITDDLKKSTNIQNKNISKTAPQQQTKTKITNTTKSNSNKTVQPVVQKQNSTPAKTSSNISKGYYIQIGIYGKKENADKAYKKYTNIDKGVIQEYSTKGSIKYKVLIGPYKNRDDAEKNLEKVIKTGHYDVYITEEK